MAASLRRNISFPASRPSHPGARKRRQGITNQPSISSPTTAAAVIPRSSTAFGSQRSSEKHPSPQPLPRQIPIDDQALIALPRVRSSEAFGRRSPYTGSNARVGPASETLNGSCRSRGCYLFPRFRPKPHVQCRPERRAGAGALHLLVTAPSKFPKLKSFGTRRMCPFHECLKPRVRVFIVTAPLIAQ
jgi:hypothetical protein